MQSATSFCTPASVRQMNDVSVAGKSIPRRPAPGRSDPGSKQLQRGGRGVINNCRRWHHGGEQNQRKSQHAQPAPPQNVHSNPAIITTNEMRLKKNSAAFSRSEDQTGQKNQRTGRECRPVPGMANIERLFV